MSITQQTERMLTLLNKAVNEDDFPFPVAFDLGTREGEGCYVTVESAVEAGIALDWFRFARHCGPLPLHLNETSIDAPQVNQ
jgi:hypothetical protein